jgi:hypothetical protein
MCALAIGAAAQAPQPKNDVRKARRDAGAAPTADEAEAFLGDAEARLAELGVKASRAAWVQKTLLPTTRSRFRQMRIRRQLR